METRNFNDDLSYEGKRKPDYDKFYESHGFEVCQRYDFITESGKKAQKADIDVQLQKDGIKYLVSEKDRSASYGDVLVEVSHIYDSGEKKRGWIYETKADLLSYFTPKCHYFINMKELKDAFDKIYPKIKDKLSDFVKSGKGFEKSGVNIDGNWLNLKFTCARNRGNGRHWRTISLCIDVADFEHLGVELEKSDIV